VLCPGFAGQFSQENRRIATKTPNLFGDIDSAPRKDYTQITESESYQLAKSS
jgi:hypothetical protein